MTNGCLSKACRCPPNSRFPSVRSIASARAAGTRTPSLRVETYEFFCGSPRCSAARLCLDVEPYADSRLCRRTGGAATKKVGTFTVRQASPQCVTAKPIKSPTLTLVNFQRSKQRFVASSETKTIVCATNRHNLLQICYCPNAWDSLGRA